MAEPNEVFGPLTDGGVIEEGAIETLKRWLPTYLQKASEQANFPAIQTPQSWGVVSEFDRFPEQGLPAIIVAAPGTNDPPVKDGAGFYRVEYTLVVFAEVAAAKGAAARKMAQLYGAAIRGALLQQSRLAGGISVAEWRGEITDTVDVAQRRTRAATGQEFSVQCRQMVTTLGGPEQPDDPDEWPEITETPTVEVQPLDNEEE